MGELVNIVGLELESFRAQLVKLKKEKEELTSELGQGKVVLDCMQAIVYKTENKLQGLLVTKSIINPTDLNKQKMTCEIYKSTTERTKFDYEELLLNFNNLQDKIVNGVKKQESFELQFDVLNAH